MPPGRSRTADGDSVPYGPVSALETRAPLFEELLRPRSRAWLWLPVVLVITFFAIAPIFVPVALLAWFVNVGRFWRTRVRVESDRVWVGRRSAPLAAFDLTTLGRAQNTWPWRTFSRRWLGGNPIWTSDSVGVRGFDGRKPLWLSVGTDRRDELVAVLEHAIPEARAASPGSSAAVMPGAAPPPGWHADPWDPRRGLRWWDGAQWTGWTHARGSGDDEPGSTGP
jgi:hypothetical protein